MTIDGKKIDTFVDRLYKAKIKRDQNGIITTGKRIKCSDPQARKVIRDCNEKCVICDKKYTIATQEDFEIHHIDGDRTNTVTKNLVLICHLHHRQITDRARGKIKDWRNTHQKNKTKKQKGQLDEFKPITTMSILGYSDNKKTCKKNSVQKSNWSDFFVR